jgi:hypothetical protein
VGRRAPQTHLCRTKPGQVHKTAKTLGLTIPENAAGHGQYAFAGQYQQSPTPRKGGIFKREYWQPYVVPSSGSRKGMWPDFDVVVVSVDTAFTEKEENDPTGCTTWGIWTDPTDGYPKVMLIMAWRKHLPIHGEEQEPRSAFVLPGCNT